MSDAGWIKLHRKVLENGWLRNPELWTFWTWCLLKASHKKMTIRVGLQQVTLEPGQFVFGRKQAGKELRMNPSKIYRFTLILKKAGNLNIKTNNKFTVITIINWVIYQGTNLEDEQQIEQQVNNKRTQTRSKELSFNKESKERDAIPKTLFLDFVFLTEGEHRKLIDLFGEQETRDYVERLNSYIGQIGESAAKKKYKSHFYVITNWARMDEQKAKGKDEYTAFRERYKEA